MVSVKKIYKYIYKKLKQEKIPSYVILGPTGAYPKHANLSSQNGKIIFEGNNYITWGQYMWVPYPSN